MDFFLAEKEGKDSFVFFFLPMIEWFLSDSQKKKEFLSISSNQTQIFFLKEVNLKSSKVFEGQHFPFPPPPSQEKNASITHSPMSFHCPIEASGEFDLFCQEKRGGGEERKKWTTKRSNLFCSILLDSHQIDDVIPFSANAS